MSKKRVVSIFQVMILLIGLISISYFISEEFHLISAANLEFINPKTGELSNIAKEGFVKISPEQVNGLNTFKDNKKRLESYLNLNNKPQGISNAPIPIYKNIYGFGEAATANVTPDAASKMYFAQGNFVDGIVSAAAWAASVATIIKMGGSLFGF